MSGRLPRFHHPRSDHPRSGHPRSGLRRDRRRRSAALLALVVGGGVALSPTVAAATTTAAPVAAAVSSAGGGWEAFADGTVAAVAGATDYGSAVLSSGHAVALVATPDGHGYWVASSTGGVYDFGDAGFFGSAATIHRSVSDVVDLTATADGQGYWLTTSTGRVLSFGDARFFGSAPTARLAVDDVVGMTATADGTGYRLSTATGRVLDFGAVRFYGSPYRAGTSLATVGIGGAQPDGYVLYGAAGQVVSYGSPKAEPTTPSEPAGAVGPPTTIVVAGRSYTFWTVPGSAPATVTAAVASSAAFPRPFAADSIWNEPLGASAAVPADSSTLVDDFVQQYQDAYGTVNINTTSYSSPDYTVGPLQPTVVVTPVNCQGGTWVDPALAAQLSAVPIPAGATPAAGTDSDLIVDQPSTDTEWELWEAKDTDGSWTACAGGRITDVSSSSGVFPAPYGVAASGLSLLGGQIHLSDIRAGSIDHALEVQIPQTAAGVVAAPADRTDGWSTAADAIPEGTRFRLDPSLDLAALHLPPAAYEIARALQTYGMVVSDTSGAVDFIAQDPSPAMAAGAPNPYDAWFAGTPSYAVLSGIPWGQLEAVSPTAP
jgi:hypothetical protein